MSDLAFGRGGNARDDRDDHDRRYGPARSEGYGYGSGRHDRDEDRGFLERAGDEVASWFGDRDAERRRRMDERQDERQDSWSQRGRGPRNYQRSDERIRDDVNDQLTDDHHLDASDVDVSVSGREVTLTGSVRSRAEKRRAEDVAESVSGVTHVQNNLRVQGAAETGSWSSSGADSTTSSSRATAAATDNLTVGGPGANL